MEQKILATALNSVRDYNYLTEVIDTANISLHGQQLLKLVGEYYATDPDAVAVDRELLIQSLDRKLSSPKVAAMIASVIRALPKDVSSANVVKEVREYKLRVIGERLATALTSNSTGDLAGLLENYQNLLASKEDQDKPIGEEEYTGTKLADLAKQSFDPKELIQIWPKELNDQIDGGARRGHHVLIFAPTEMGKTLFAINAVAGFLAQNLKVLYIGNEDPAPDIIMRLATNLLGRTKHDVLVDPCAADTGLSKLRWDRFTLASMAPGTFSRINRLCTSGAYDVVVIDQLRNVDVKSGNRTEGLERAATEARNLARKANVLVVSVTQAADSASGKLVLTRGDVDSSNVGIPGQCDLMIGLGATAQMEEMNQRMISLPKNKLSGNHSPIPIRIDPTTSKVL